MHNNNWEEICYLINSHKSSSEDLFQSEIINILEKLGWSRFNKEIEEKRKISIGFESSLQPDIIVKNKDRDLFVIELKKPTAKYLVKNNSQLFSYLRQTKLNVGLLINDRIHVFYEDINCNVPVEIMNIEFNCNAQDGLKFIELFSKQSYNHEVLINYCKNQIRGLEAIDYLTSEEYKSKIIEFIKVNACEKFSKDIIELALKSIEIDVTNIIDITETEKSNYQFVNNEKNMMTNESNSTENQIEKIKRKIPRWLNNPHQINTKILIKAMEILSIKESMSYNALVKQCVDIDNFKTNFDQMANFGAKNNGKVFERDGDNVTLWIPVKDFVRESYSAFKLSSYK